MLQSIEAVVDQDGNLRTLEPIEFPRFRRVIITILDDEAEESVNLTELSEVALAQDWDRLEEDEAWSHLAELPPV